MGLLVEGKWQDRWYETQSSGGRFIRTPPAFRRQIAADGSADFPAVSGRYHLYVAYACPWAHRTLIMRELKQLAPHVAVTVVDPLMGEQGWRFGHDGDDDPLYAATYLHELYARAKPDYTGRVTVPVLWDTQTHTIVNNESSEIIRMFNSGFGELADASAPDYYPEALRDEIDAVNDRVYNTVNNGVYRCGFATTQAAYDEAFAELWDTLEWLEARLSKQRYLMGAAITEADIRLFTTLVRFDPVYHGHFKCNRRRLVEMPNLWNYTLELYQLPGVAKTVNLEQITRHYYWSHTSINPTRIVPRGPDIDYSAAHDRQRFIQGA
ncbi:MAG: glutathione S-transferase family protein [Myxococcales bacterium]|nr:glutathione S-transferase family protein [Myxococcales bacterium]